jgi:hypothetical protein
MVLSAKRTSADCSYDAAHPNYEPCKQRLAKISTQIHKVCSIHGPAEVDSDIRAALATFGDETWDLGDAMVDLMQVAMAGLYDGIQPFPL